MAFQIGIRHTKQFEFEKKTNNFWTKEILYTNTIEEKNPEIQAIPDLFYNDEGKKQELHETYLLEHSKRLFCVYKSEFQIQLTFPHRFRLIEFDAEKGIFGSSCAFINEVTGLAELPDHNIVVSDKYGDLWVFSPKLRTLHHKRRTTHVNTIVISSFLNGFVFVDNYQQFYDPIPSDSKLIYSEFVTEDLSFKNCLLLEYGRSRTKCLFYPQGTSFVLSLWDFSRNYGGMYRNIALYYGWFDDETRKTHVYEQSLPGDSNIHVYHRNIIMPEGILIRMERRKDSFFLVGYRLVHQQTTPSTCFEVTLGLQYEAIFPDVGDPHGFYMIKRNSVIDRFQLVYPGQNLVNMCCQILASTLKASYQEVLQPIIPEELLKTIGVFLPRDWTTILPPLPSNSTQPHTIKRIHSN